MKSYVSMVANSRFYFLVLMTSFVLLMSLDKASANEDDFIMEQYVVKNSDLDELEIRQQFKTLVDLKFQSGDFDLLEKIARRLVDEKLTTSSGISKLTLFDREISDTLYSMTKQKDGPSEMERLVNAWVKQYPTSTSAHIAYAHMLLQRGWSARGRGYSNTVKPESWPVFFEYVELTRKYLQDHEQFRNKDPRWDMLIIEIAMHQNVSDQEFSSLSRSALERNPDYYQLYFTIMERHLPKWGGSSNELEKFASSSAQYAKAIDGDAIYARIYWAAAQSQFDKNLFDSSTVSWQRMKLGIGDVLRKYPDKWNTYNFGMLACFAGDQEKTRELLIKIPNKNINHDWPYAEYLDQCKTFAGLEL